MNDERSPEESRAREAVQSLGTPRLDAVTRRRLVRTAMQSGDRGGADRVTRWVQLGAAAAAVVVIAVVAVSLTRSSTRESAQFRDSGSTQDAESSSPASDELLASAPDLGEVTSLDEAGFGLLAFDQASGAVTPEGLAPGPVPVCADTVSAATVVQGYARATYRGEPALVVAGRDPDGMPIVLAVATDDCGIVETLGR